MEKGTTAVTPRPAVACPAPGATPIVFAFANFVVPIQIGDGFTFLNTFSTIGSFVLGASTLPFLYNVWKSYKVGQLVTVDDPWGAGNSLEWATSSPPPLRNFDRMPRIRSERPAFDAKFPELAAGAQSIAGPPEGGARPLAAESDGGPATRRTGYQEDRLPGGPATRRTGAVGSKKAGSRRGASGG